MRERPRNHMSTLRSALMDQAYFDALIKFREGNKSEDEALVQALPATDRRRGRLLHALFRDSYEVLITRYSRGDDVATLAMSFPPIVDALERSVSAGGAYQVSFKSIDDYVRSLWLVSFAVLFNVDAALFARLLAALGNAGEDALFERLAATRVGGRPSTKKLLWPKPFQSLYDASTAPPAEAPKFMKKFLESWYKSLDDCYWHENHKGPEGGGYFGYWSIEAAGVVQAFGIDDKSFREMPYYPRDLVRRA